MVAATNDEIVDKLDLILRVLSLQVAVNQSVTERVRLLKLAGLDTGELDERGNDVPVLRFDAGCKRSA